MSIVTYFVPLVEVLAIYRLRFVNSKSADFSIKNLYNILIELVVLNEERHRKPRAN